MGWWGKLFVCKHPYHFVPLCFHFVFSFVYFHSLRWHILLDEFLKFLIEVFRWNHYRYENIPLSSFNHSNDDVTLRIKHDANHLLSCTKVPEKTHIQILFDVNSKRKFFTALSKLMWNTGHVKPKILGYRWRLLVTLCYCMSARGRVRVGLLS